jgi:undecaprenyl-diphosphatase
VTKRHPILAALAWLGSHERGVLVSGALILCGIWFFVALADEVIEGGTERIDRRILLAMRNPHDLRDPVGPKVVEEAVRDITGLGGVTILGLLTAAVAGFLVLDGKRRMALFVCASVASGALASNALKLAFNRPRPDLVPHGMYTVSTSFPSGHSMLSAVTYLTLGALLSRSEKRKRVKAYFLVLAALLTMLVGISRVYLGVHWPSDVLAGWTAGAVWALLCWTGARWLQSRRTIEPESEGA